MRSLKGFGLGVVAVVCVSMLGVGVAGAESLRPWWGVGSGSRPSVLPKGGGQLVVTVENLGDGDANGKAVPIQIEDVLPAGLSAVSVEGLAGAGHGKEIGPMVCSEEVSVSPLVCTFSGVLHAYEPLEMRIVVKVSKTAVSGELNRVSVWGGGSSGVKTVSRPVVLGKSTAFGIQENSVALEEVGGGVDTQAGCIHFRSRTHLCSTRANSPRVVMVAKSRR